MVFHNPTQVLENRRLENSRNAVGGMAWGMTGAAELTYSYEPYKRGAPISIRRRGLASELHHSRFYDPRNFHASGRPLLFSTGFRESCKKKKRRNLRLQIEGRKYVDGNSSYS